VNSQITPKKKEKKGGKNVLHSLWRPDLEPSETQKIPSKPLAAPASSSTEDPIPREARRGRKKKKKQKKKKKKKPKTQKQTLKREKPDACSNKTYSTILE
jgi:hypothetical protein